MTFDRKTLLALAFVFVFPLVQSCSLGLAGRQQARSCRRSRSGAITLFVAPRWRIDFAAGLGDFLDHGSKGCSGEDMHVEMRHFLVGVGTMVGKNAVAAVDQI